MDLTTLIKSRRTIRRYRSTKVSKALLRKILDSARWAPSLHNMQPWKFIIPESKMKKELINALKHSQNKELLFIRLILRNSIKTIENAPTVVLVYNDGILSNKAKKGGRAYRNYFNNANTFEIQSVACAIQNMLLTAHSFGLGAAWFGIPIFSEKSINRLFGVNYRLMAILTIGYPAKKPKPPVRKPLSEIVTFRK